MGIQGLLPFLQEASRKCYINEFKGYTVAIDSYCWLHKGAFSCAEKIVRGESTNLYVKYCLKYLELLISHNIKPIMIFDGQRLPAKKTTELRRRESRQTAKVRGNELLRLGKTQEAFQYFRQCVDITHEMALALIKECRSRNIDCIVAPYEADAQLTYLNLKGIADLIITEDSDLVMFGCSKILFKFSLDGSGILVENDKLYKAMKVKTNEFNFDKFRYMCIMSGCDYLDSLPGIGLKRAHKAITMTVDPDIYKLLKRLPSYLNLRNLVVSEEYLENFKLADATVRYQIVYDPIKRSLVRLNDPLDDGVETQYLKNAGEICNDNLAFQMALGNIDPISKKVMDTWDPDSKDYVKSVWSKDYQKLNHKINLKIKTMKIHVSSNVVSTEEMTEYDNQLSKELKMYQLVEEQPIKKQKFNDQMSNNTLESETAFSNPFAKVKKERKLSKFLLTKVDTNNCIKSKFFSSQTNNVDTKSEDVITNSTINEDGMDSQLSHNVDVKFNFQEFTSNKCLQQSNNDFENDLDARNNEEKEEKLSPILSFSHTSRYDNHIQSPSLEMFKFNQHKKLTKQHKLHYDVNNKCEGESLDCGITMNNMNKSVCESSTSHLIESDIENLTPEDNCMETEVEIDNCTESQYQTNFYNNDCSMNTKTSDQKFLISKSKALSQETEKISSNVRRRSNSCRFVGLSRNKKRVPNNNQQTLFSMFSKMSSKD